MREDEAREETVERFEVPEGYAAGERVDVYLTRAMPNASRSKVQRGIKEGRVTVNGAVVEKPSQALQAGDSIACRVMRPPRIEARPEDIPLDVVYEDDYLLVVNKAPGMVVHPAYGNRTGTLVNALLHHVGAETLSLEDEDEEAPEFDDDDVGLSTVNAVPELPGMPTIRPGIVHRLDKDTSGLLVVAKDDVTHRGLALQFAERTIQRRYLAIVWGVPSPPDGTVDGPIGRHPRDRKRMAVVPEARGKNAVTHYETVEPYTYSALVRFRLETGRTHQIRVHALHLGHPVMGDATYDGDKIRKGPVTARRRAFYNNVFQAMPRQALHAHTLGFVHPATGDTLHFEADLPEDMQTVLDKLRRVDF